MAAYEEALQLVKEGKVACRTLRWVPSGVVGPGVTAPLSVNVLFAFEQPYNQNNPLGQEAFSIFPACLDFPGNNPYFFLDTYGKKG